MSNYEKKMAGGHPIAGIILGILGILVALLLTFLFGAIAGGVALLLGVIALLLGIGARKSGRGMGAIIMGALAIVLAVSMTFVSANMMKEMRQRAADTGVAPVFTDCFRSPYLGLVSVVMNAAGDQTKADALAKEMDQLQKMIQNNEEAVPAVN